MRPLPCVLALVAASALAACATTRDSYVSSAVPRGGYLDAVLSLPAGDSRLLFPQSEDCLRVIRLEAPVTYTSAGAMGFGRVAGPDGTRCDPVGIGDLRRWRARQPRQEGDMAPSSAASWTVVHTDGQTHILRGRFPTASRLGLTGTFDAVLFVPNDGGTCTRTAEEGNATLVFRTAGSRVLELGPCPVEAIARPLSGGP